MLNDYNLRAVAFVLFFSLVFSCLAGSGGPDTYGYTWKDSSEPEVTFSWVDILSRPDAVQITGLGDDDYSQLIPLGFVFRYYWIDFQSIRIGANGWLSFDGGSTNNTWCFQNLPSTNPTSTHNTLAPLMSDMTFNSGYAAYPNPGELWYWTNNADSFVVTFVDMPWWKDDTSGTVPPDWIGMNTFQVILDGRDTTITYQYLDLTQSAFVDRSECASEIVVGIENSTGHIGLQTLVESVPPDSFAIRFYYPAEDTFEVRDAKAIWSMNEEGKGRFFLLGDTLSVTGAVTNAGNVVIDTPVVLETALRTEFQGTVWITRDTLDTLAPGPPLPVQYPQGPVLNQAGQYFVAVEVRQPGDLNPYNNRAECEANVVSGTDSAIVLRYAYNQVTGTSISWPSGNNGVGMYIHFPYYPYRITALEAFIVGNDLDTLTPLPSGFLLELHDDDGPGIPGTPLGSIPVSSFAARDGWNYRALPDPLVIDEGGFYVSWIQGGPGIGLGTQRPGPKSRHTYEIFSGNWAPYRFADQEDLMIRVYIDRFWVSADAPAPEPFAGLKLVPNPNAGQFALQFRQNQPGPVRVTVLDLQGRKLLEREMGPSAPGRRTMDLDLGTVAAGIYLVEIRQGLQKHVEKLAIRP